MIEKNIDWNKQHGKFTWWRVALLSLELIAGILVLVALFHDNGDSSAQQNASPVGVNSPKQQNSIVTDRDELIRRTQKMGFSRGCAEQMLHVMTNPANIGRDYKDLFTVDCLPEVNRYDRSVKDKVLSDTAKAFGTTTDALKAFANIPDREFKASIEREEQRIREGSKNDLDLKWAMKNEKATHDCIEVRGPQNCGTGEDLQPFRDRLVLFLVADKEVWLSPEDEGFRSLQPYSIDHQRKRETLLAALGDYSSTTIDSIQNSAARPQQITEVQNDKVVVRPSFDCAMARSPVELLICGDGYLASLEVGMASAYNQALARVRDDGRKTLKQQHLNWFRNYSRTCNRADNDTDRTTCVSSFLSARTSDLNNLR